MYFACLITLVLNFVPGVIAQSRSVTVDPATAKLGEDATMAFTFTPAPGEALLYVAWFKSDAGGAQVEGITNNLTGNPQPNGRYSLSSNGYLIISDVMKDDAGYYLCRITTSNGNDAQGLSTLTVHYLETPTLEPKNTYVIEKKNAIFACSLPDGVPTPITITWIKDGGALDLFDSEKYPQSDTTLEISRVNEMDEGDYQCRAETAAYSGDEGKLSNRGTLSLTNLVFPPKTSTLAATSTDLVSLPLTSRPTSAVSEPEVTQVSPNCEPCSGSDIGLTVGMTFVGIVIGIVFSSSVSVFLWTKPKMSSSNSSKEMPTGKQEKTYMTYNTSEQKTEEQTYQELRTNVDNSVVYMNVKTKR